ncbi:MULTISPECIES: ABC transporter ATP-binding protein [Flavobacteriales]|uniref:Osmoprotectant transport system ATP-binding protein n=2 Tax=Flavobacteriales TaxID=200644 RepID=A0A1M6N7Z6_9FLAO|nr:MULTISPECIES: ABC transporter ATP-binding protein [Flavobacteriales]SHG70680.1 osmoprotectant transport system ATP-binding protein [Flavobacterium johnsoniae]SHJ91782.1 osmoprotectant transport system ATP-binding protein [Epilithonimonas mollis]
MISIRQVSKSFGAHSAIENVDLNIAEGEHAVLLGPSGSGKTTLLRMINGLVVPSAGTISINGKDIQEQPQDELRRRIGYVLQRNSLFPHYTVEENISVVPSLLKWNKQTTAQRVRELMAKLHLPEKYLSRRPEELSGGEAQRVNIARALATDPPVLLMDEPFSALDAITRKSIREEFMRLDEFRKKTIIMVSHDIQEAFSMANTVVLLRHGKLVQQGMPSELLYNPANDFVKDFLSNDYLKLSLGVTSIDDLWNYLSGESGDEEGLSAEPVGDTTLWNAMERFQHNTENCQFITMRHEYYGESKRITWSDLMNAYRLHQNDNQR